MTVFVSHMRWAILMCVICALFCHSVSRPRVGIFIRVCTSSLCTTKRDLQGNRVIPVKQVAGRTIHAFSMENLSWSIERGRRLWLYLVGGPHSPHHSTTSGLCGIFKKVPLLGVNPAPYRLLLIVCGFLFAELGPALFTASFLNSVLFLI